MSVCLMRRDHALSHAPLSLEAFSAAEHVVVTSAGTGHGRVYALLDRDDLFWHNRQHRDSANLRLRELMLGLYTVKPDLRA